MYYPTLMWSLIFRSCSGLKKSLDFVHDVKLQ